MAMKLCTSFALFFSFSSYLLGQAVPSKPAEPRTIQNSLAFSPQPGGTAPVGWAVNPPSTIHLDKQIIHSGQWSVRFDRNSSSDGQFSVITHSIPVDFMGNEVELHGYMRTKDVANGYAGLWMREDGNGRMIKLDNMAAQHIDGTRDWAEYSIKLPIDKNVEQLFFGALLEGTGTMWVDDLRLLVDGKPIERPLTILDTDHEFDNGSKLQLSSVTPAQVDNLVTLARVWGFLKYHHPTITEGKRHWDYELLRILPPVLAAPDASHENEILLRWIDSLGEIPSCSVDECTPPPADNVFLKPDLDWIRDRSTLGPALSLRLQQIYRTRSHRYQFYVSIPFSPAPRNASFNHEPFYQNIQLPDPGFQLLALFRWWNIIQYWAPYRVDAGQNWPSVLAEFIPKIALARDRTAYQLAMMELIAKANDTHANLWSSLGVRPPVGSCALPVHLRFIDGKAVVTGSAAIDAPSDSALHPGDVIDSLDDKPVATLTAEWTPYYADSNVAALRRDMARSLTHGACAPVSVTVIRKGEPVQLHLERQSPPDTPDPEWHDLPGETFRLLSPDIAYLKLSSVKVANIPEYIERAANTKALIVDIRNYPSEFVPFALGQYLVTRPTDFAAVTVADLGNPGAFHFERGDTIQPGPTHYNGKVVILVDEVSQSSAEYTAMALRSSPNAVIVGSMTAGADGNVSQIPLPGGLRTLISGIGIFFPDHRPTQRIGIVPDLEAKPTLAGIKAGRDEVLEAAIRQILGPAISAAEIESLAKPNSKAAAGHSR